MSTFVVELVAVATRFPSFVRVCLAAAEDAPIEPPAPSASPAQLVSELDSCAIGPSGTTDAFIVVPLGAVVTCSVVAPVDASARTGSFNAARTELGGAGVPGGMRR